MIRSEFFKVVVLMAIASGLFGQEKAAVGSVAKGEPQQKLARSGELVIPEKIHPQVRALAERGGVIPVFIVLLSQPQKAIFERARAASQSRREIVDGRYTALADQLFPLAGELAQAQEASDALELETRQAAFQEIEQSIKPEQDAMEADLTAMGGRNITRYRGVNMLAADIPASALPLLESDPRIAEVAPVEKQTAQLSTSVPALEAPTFWSNGYTGQGQSVAVFDTGVRTNHPAFAGKTINSRVFLTYGSLDPCFGDNAALGEDQQGHGTHVAGIVMSQGSSGWSNYQGVAKGISTLYNVKVGFKQRPGSGCTTSGLALENDVYAGLDWLVASTPVKVVNYSYGSSTLLDDPSNAKRWDWYADNFGLSVAVSAGNDGPTSVTVSTPGVGYNVLSVANWASRGSIWTTSSRGPTAGGRYKPDLAAPGTGIYSTAWNWDLASPFVVMTGTSMAAPHVAGSIALLRSAGITNPLAVKAVLLNTTDSLGWAADRGWGYTNLERAWSQRSFIAGSLTAAGTPNGHALYKIPLSGSLYATMTWNRHIIGGSTPAFNDLDLYLYGANANNLLDLSATAIQNVEQVSASYYGDAVLKVEMASAAPLAGVSSEPFAVALNTSNWTAVSGPALGVTCSGPSVVAPGAAFSVSCTARNTGDLTAFAVSGSLNWAGGSGGSVQDYGTLTAGASATKSWNVTVSSTLGSRSMVADVSSSSFGETFSATGNYNFNVQSAGTAPSVTSILPAAPTLSVSSQTLTVNGTGFQSGLTVTAFPPGGGSLALSGSQIQSVTSASFNLTITLNSAGTWGIRVNNPDSQLSGTFNFAVQCAYAISTSGLSVPASGGYSTLTIRTDAGCSWSVVNFPAWLIASGASQGSGSGTVNLYSYANSGAARLASLSVGGVSVPIRQLDGAACGGSATCVLRALPHLAYGGQWTTALSAISSGSAASSFSASFYGDAGSSLALPFTGGLGNLSTLTGTVSAGGLRYYEAENPSVGDLSGWALVTADESVAAQVTFRRRTPAAQFYEAAVPSSGGYSRFVMPFDVGTFAPNGAQLFTAFAVVNLNPSAAAHFACTARSDSGVLIPNAVSIPALAPLGHYTAFNFPLLTGRGTLDCSADTLVSAIGVRSIGGDAVSTLPVIPK